MVWSDTSWVGIFPGEAPMYVDHIQAAVETAGRKLDAILVFSGGQTRAEA